jgi:hypothetical protein
MVSPLPKSFEFVNRSLYPFLFQENPIYVRHWLFYLFKFFEGDLCKLAMMIILDFYYKTPTLVLFRCKPCV